MAASSSSVSAAAAEPDPSGGINMKSEGIIHTSVTTASIGGGGGEASEAGGIVPFNDHLLLYRGLKKAKKERGCTAKERISKMPPCAAGKRSSIYRGVTRHRWTGRYEAHLWDKSTWNQNQNKKGKQVYLGAYDDEEAAARAYDLAALKYWGSGTLINFPVTDYTRDLEEMRQLSREEYLASLRRKSSGFSRGIAKYRGLSGSRWDASLGRMSGTEYLNSINFGDETAINSKYAGGFCIERKIDLTCYIKWWGANRICLADSLSKSSEETKRGTSEDIGGEIQALGPGSQPTEPYQMPKLGISYGGKKLKSSSVSAMSILSRSAAFKSLKEKSLNKEETNVENDENENKCNIEKINHDKAVEKSLSHDSESDKLGVVAGMSRESSLQRNVYPLIPFLPAPLLTTYSDIDSMADPILWSSLVSALPTGLPHTAEVTKAETISSYTFFQQHEQ